MSTLTPPLDDFWQLTEWAETHRSHELPALRSFSLGRSSEELALFTDCFNNLVEHTPDASLDEVYPYFLRLWEELGHE